MANISINNQRNQKPTSAVTEPSPPRVLYTTVQEDNGEGGNLRNGRGEWTGTLVVDMVSRFPWGLTRWPGRGNNFVAKMVCHWLVHYLKKLSSSSCQSKKDSESRRVQTYKQTNKQTNQRKAHQTGPKQIMRFAFLEQLNPPVLFLWTVIFHHPSPSFGKTSQRPQHVVCSGLLI